MKFSLVLGVALISAFLIGCNKDSLKGCEEHSKSLCNEDINKTNIRIINNSKYDFCNVVLNPTGGNVNYGIIEKGTSTCYKVYDKAFNYAYTSLQIGDETFTFQPIDYVGEPELGTGKFSYSIDVLSYGDRTLTITANKD
ncbi:MAG: hypothetical protein AB8B74_09000 [Crocinitomicaceae bacterium]